LKEVFPTTEKRNRNRKFRFISAFNNVQNKVGNKGKRTGENREKAKNGRKEKWDLKSRRKV